MLTPEQLTARNLTKSLQQADRSLQIKIMGPQWTPSSKELVTLQKVNARMDGLTFNDLFNIVEPVLIDKVFKTELTTFLANNPWTRFYNSTDEYGRVKEHIINLAGTIVNLVGDTAGDFGSYEMKAGFKENDLNPSTLDFFDSKTIVYYTKHIRAFVQVASFNFTEMKGAFQSQGAWDSFTSSKTQMLMEQATEEESAVISNMVASMLIPRNILLEDSADDNTRMEMVTQPKLTLLGNDYQQSEFVQYLQRFTNNVKFPKTAIKENPLGLPLITKGENLVAYVTPDILASQNFLEAYAFSANKLTLPETTEMFAPLPPVAVTDLPVDSLGTVHGVSGGKYTGKVLPIAFIGDIQAIDVVHSELYTDSEVNKLREFMSAQVHDHMHVHLSYEKNIRFFAVPVEDEKLVLSTTDKLNIVGTTDETTADGSITPPDTLLDTYGNTVKVTSVLTNSSGKKANMKKLAVGTYQLTFSADGYEDVSMNVDVAVKVVSVTDVKVTPTTLSLKVGETGSIVGTVVPDNATNKNVKYTSSNPAIATVDDKGTVKGIAVSDNNGISVLVISEDGNFQAICVVKVTTA